MNDFYHLQAAHFAAVERAAEQHTKQLKALKDIQEKKGYGDAWYQDKVENLQAFLDLIHSSHKLVNYLFGLLEGVIKGQVSMSPPRGMEFNFEVSAFLFWLENEASFKEVEQVLKWAREHNLKLELTRHLSAAQVGQAVALLNAQAKGVAA